MNPGSTSNLEDPPCTCPPLPWDRDPHCRRHPALKRVPPLVPDSLPRVMPEAAEMCRTCGGTEGMTDDGRCETCHAEDEAYGWTEGEHE